MNYANEPHGVFFMIDNKSFYASVEAAMRGIDPLESLMVVMSEQENTNGGLILSTSPKAKKKFNLKVNVSRKRDLPDDPHIMTVPPRMNLYIRRNLQINEIFKKYVAEEDLYPYSIDESILDVTKTWKLFGDSPLEVAKKIQRNVQQELGLYTTIGIGENPIQAKLALDNYAKKSEDLIGVIKYATVPATIWSISELEKVWGIGRRTAAHLRRVGIDSVYELAHANPFALKQEFGIIGTQIFATAWGIDRTVLKKRVTPRSSSIGNSQVLPYDYLQQSEIETVIKEISEQVGSRLRHKKRQCGEITLSVNFAFDAEQQKPKGGFSQAVSLSPTNDNGRLFEATKGIFRKYWQGEAVRYIAIYTTKLTQQKGEQLNLFELDNELSKDNTDWIVDEIRDKYGFTSLVYARSLVKGGTAIQRADLVGGHRGGNAYE